MRGETSEIALVTQYNDRGIFIVLEELGYICMSISFFFLGFVFCAKNYLQHSIRWLLPSSFFLTVLLLIFYSVRFGVGRSYRFEVASISINWLTAIVTGILVAVVIKKRISLTILT